MLATETEIPVSKIFQIINEILKRYHVELVQKLHYRNDENNVIETLTSLAEFCTPVSAP